MTLDIPKVIVNTTTQVQSTIPEGLAGDVAVIADLGTSSTDIIIANNHRELKEKLGDTILASPTNDVKGILKLFEQKGDNNGVTSVTIAPVGSTYTYTTFGNALDKLESEDFDILAIPKPIAYETTTISSTEVADIYMKLIKDWKDTRYTNKEGVGLIFAMEESTTTGQDVKTRITDFGRGGYCILVQKVNNLTFPESVCFMTATIAGMQLNKSLTHKIVPGIESIQDEVLFKDSNSEGYQYMNKGITVLRPFNRRLGEYGVLRSVTPEGLDLSIERSADYMTKEFQLKDFLGDSSNHITIDSIQGEINTKKRYFIETLGLCEEINSTVTKVDKSTVEVDLEYVFDGIIDLIKVFIQIKVE